MKQDIRKNYHKRMHQRAKELRQSQTSAEEQIWETLRNKQLGGFKFRRQHPIGHLIADFCCPQCKLVIELDGEIHKQQQEYDTARSKWLEQQGYHILRFWNHEITDNLDGVITIILNTCKTILTHRPQP